MTTFSFFFSILSSNCPTIKYRWCLKGLRSDASWVNDRFPSTRELYTRAVVVAIKRPLSEALVIKVRCWIRMRRMEYFVCRLCKRHGPAPVSGIYPEDVYSLMIIIATEVLGKRLNTCTVWLNLKKKKKEADTIWIKIVIVFIMGHHTQCVLLYVALMNTPLFIARHVHVITYFIRALTLHDLSRYSPTFFSPTKWSPPLFRSVPG